MSEPMTPERLAEIEAWDLEPFARELIAEVRRLRAQRDAALAIQDKHAEPLIRPGKDTVECVCNACRMAEALGVTR